MSRNDLFLTESILEAEKKLRELSSLSRDGQMMAVKNKASEIGDIMLGVRLQAMGFPQSPKP